MSTGCSNSGVYCWSQICVNGTQSPWNNTFHGMETLLHHWLFVGETHQSLVDCPDKGTILHYWPSVRGIHQWIPLSKGTVMWSFEVSLVVSVNKVVNIWSISWPWCSCYNTVIRADSRFTLSQWETALLCNVSHWLGASLESALVL